MQIPLPDGKGICIWYARGSLGNGIAVRGAIQAGGYANAYMENGKIFFCVDADIAGNAANGQR